MEERIIQLEKQLKELTDYVNRLKNSTTIPYEIDGAFRMRFSFGLDISSKASDSEDVEAVTNINFSAPGYDTDPVLGSPAGYVEGKIGGSIKKIPYYD